LVRERFGGKQFELSEEILFRYIASESCWTKGTDESGNCNAPENGEIDAGTLSIDQPASGDTDACVADLDWSLFVERIDR
jgi:hypothetical protein